VIPGLRGFWAGLMLVLLATSPSVRGNGAREFLIQNWTREDGLPGSTVTAVAQTPDGYLWVGTLNGLVRFDGVRFVGVDLGKLAGQRNSSVFCLHADRQGDLWIGMGDGQLIRFSHGEFTSHMPPSYQTADRYIQRMADDKAGGLWTLNYEGGVSRLTGSTFNEVAAGPEHLALIPNAAGGVWIASRSELKLSAGNELTRVWDASREPGFQPESLAAARDGGCWIAGNGCVRRFEGGQLREPRAKLQGKPAAVTGFLEDREGNLWLGTYGGGVEMIDKVGMARQVTREQGLPSDLVRCLFEDRDGNLWAGLEARGLARIRRAMFASYGRAEGFSDETVLSLCEGEHGEVWIGTNGDGVYRIKNRHVQHYGIKEGLTNQFVWALQQDRTGKLWAGTWGGGLYRLENERFVNTGPELGAASVVLALHEDRRGTLWLGQRTGPERVIEAVEHGQRRTFAVPGAEPRLDVRTIAETPDGSLWFGTFEQGLLRWKDDRFQDCDLKSGLPPGGVNTLHVDDAGDLWVASPGTGLVLWKNDQFTPIIAARSLLDDNLNQITDDGLGYFWFGLGSGVVRMRAADLRRFARGESPSLEWQRFTKADGLPSNECSGTGRRTRDGRIWFPTLAGVAVVDPRQVTTSPAPPPVLVEEVLLAGRRIFDGSDIRNTAWTKEQRSRVAHSSSGPIPVSPLRIPPGGGPLDIGYTALNFVAPERVRFLYQLVGLDESPVEAGSARAVRYSYLPPGKYEFHVTASNEGGDWNEVGARLAFEVLPRYWQTWWFRVAAACALLGATAVIARLVITRRLRRRMELLEQQHALEAERSRISQDLHDDLGTSLTEINFLTAVAGSPNSSTAEVKGYLASINDKSLELVKALDEIVWAVNPKNDSLRNLVNYLCLFAQDYLRPAAIQCRLDVSPGLPDLTLNAEQRHTLFLVTKEALANAAKHSAATAVWLHVSLKDSRLSLVIEDNGRGFDPSVLKPDRNGLKNIAARMLHLNGSGMVHSVASQGTRVELELPLR